VKRDRLGARRRPECLVADIDVPVLVVGAGAAGTLLALELARHGVAARVVDRLAGPSPYSRAVTVHARMLEIFEQIDAELAATYLEVGHASPGYVMHYVTADGTRHAVRPGLDFTGLPSRYRFLLLNSQRETERILRGYLGARYGCAPEWGVTCTAVAVEAEGVRATLQHADGLEEQVRCRYLVACDGTNSRVRRDLGLAQEGSDYAGTVLQNLDIELNGFPDDPEWMHYCMGPGHFVMVAKLPGRFFRLLMSQPADKADASETPHAVFGAILAQHFDGIRFGETDWHSRWGSQIRLAHSYRCGPVFLAGDAAHTHSTAGGQGMNCCMQDAWNLGWKLAFVLKGWAPDTLLDSYEAERKPIGQQVIGAASAIHELFMAGRTGGPEALVALRESGFLRELVGKVSGVAYHYRADGAPDSALPQAGDRLPNVLLRNTEWLGDALRHVGFTLIAALTSDESDVVVARKLDELERVYAGRLRVRTVLRAPLPLVTVASGPQLYLVRPDGYVALRCAAEDFAVLERWLAASLTPVRRE
jgi:2-polyprenyl-6-methoxyphenol hydroxylase-like FAD-dependent oxidoreductase